jgi:hypothetical protein
MSRTWSKVRKISPRLSRGKQKEGVKSKSPIPVLEKYHARITKLHLKDRNVPWGQTPIKEVRAVLPRGAGVSGDRYSRACGCAVACEAMSLTIDASVWIAAADATDKSLVRAWTIKVTYGSPRLEAVTFCDHLSSRKLIFCTLNLFPR